MSRPVGESQARRVEMAAEKRGIRRSLDSNNQLNTAALSLRIEWDYDVAMGKIFEQIRTAVANDRFFVAWHADERCEERGITAWQLVTGLEEAKLVRERPRSKPNPSAVVRQILEDGSEVEVIWSWLGETRQAKLVTVYLAE
jgi:hypothetical protein